MFPISRLCKPDAAAAQIETFLSTRILQEINKTKNEELNSKFFYFICSFKKHIQLSNFQLPRYRQSL